MHLHLLSKRLIKIIIELSLTTNNDGEVLANKDIRAHMLFWMINVFQNIIPCLYGTSCCAVEDLKIVVVKSKISLFSSDTNFSSIFKRFIHVAIQIPCLYQCVT